MPLYIHGIGHFHPEHIIDNAFLESLDIGTTPDWIIQRVGIQQRRSVLPLTYIQDTLNKNPSEAAAHADCTLAEAGAHAAEKALQHAGVTPDQIGLVLSGGCDSDYCLPANAAVIADALGIQAEAWDLRSACSTFATHIHTLNRMQPNTLPDYILVVIPENWTRSIDFSDRKTAVLVGDASVALVISATIPSPAKITHSTLVSDPSGWEKVQTPAYQHFHQDGPTVQRFAIKKTLSTVQSIQANASLEAGQFYFIGHQANLLMLEAVCRKLDIPEHRHLFNVDRYGNCGAAGAPSVLSEHWNHFQPHDSIILAVVGSGLTWGGILIEIGESI